MTIGSVESNRWLAFELVFVSCRSGRLLPNVIAIIPSLSERDTLYSRFTFQRLSSLLVCRVGLLRARRSMSGLNGRLRLPCMFGCVVVVGEVDAEI